MKTAKRLIAVLVLCLLLAGCGEDKSAGVARKVAMITKSSDTAFWKSVFAGAQAAASEYNVDLTIFAPSTEEELEQQNELIDRAVENGAEAIVLSAISYDGNAAAVERAMEKDVEVVVIDSDVHTDKVSARISTDNVDAGRKAGQAAICLREGSLVVGMVNFGEESRNGQQREAGAREVLEASKLVEGLYPIHVQGAWGNACAGTKKLLEEHPDINVIIAFDETTTVGVAVALEELGKSDTVEMVGFDSNVRAVDLMYSGTVSALIVQNPYAMGYLGVEKANMVLNGKKSEPETRVDVSSVVVYRQDMFTLESQRALFPFSDCTK